MTGHGRRVVVVGLGVQGRKRLAAAGGDVVATVDPAVEDADYRRIEDVPLHRYEAALVCTPDDVKLSILEYLLEHGRHVLVEKPLIAGDDHEIERLAKLAAANGAVCRTAYNHRFEPHVVRLREVLASGSLGPIYRLRAFYGNGTARPVRESPWRDKGAGVLADLGSHLLDLCLFLLGSLPTLETWAAHRFENRALDHVVCGAGGPPLVELEMSLVSWRNQFVLEVVGEHGSATVDSLCKWGPSTFTLRRRVLPSGVPLEESAVVVRPDPTWASEYADFVRRYAGGATVTLARDLAINRSLRALAASAGASA